MNSTVTPGQESVRSWLGIPYATADRFRSPKIVPFDPDRPYDEKGHAPVQAGDTSWLEADNGFSEEQSLRDVFVRDAVLDLASRNSEHLWEKVTRSPTTKGLGTMPYDATSHAENTLEIFDGINRP